MFITYSVIIIFAHHQSFSKHIHDPSNMPVRSYFQENIWKGKEGRKRSRVVSKDEGEQGIERERAREVKQGRVKLPKR